MPHYYYSDLYSTGGWFFWFGIFFLALSALANWGVTTRAQGKVIGGSSRRNVLAGLDEQYAQGEIRHDEYIRMKSSIIAISA